ncbi:hypothetical protein C8R44DRAFT_381361 [Mycena epipterygia]|nr:hypothetical protein C8R44DRAFT_381361 [Mycena epipterygia]
MLTKPSKTSANLKAFLINSPFHAPAIIDLIHETWWSSPKALGFKYVSMLKSHRKDRPSEVTLPDAMICMAGAHVWAALQPWQTGHYILAPEFSQGRLKGTYKSLLDILHRQRASASSKTFNKVMHDLYLRVSGSQAGPATALGSVNNVICLDIDSD